MNSTVDDRMAGGHNLDEPHFDEESTILARPVVPLDEVRAEKRSKAGVAVALAIGGGLLIGLLTATMIYRYLGAGQVPRGDTTTVAEQPASPAGEQTSNQLPGPSGGAIGVYDSAVTSVEDETQSETNGQEAEDEEPKQVKTQDRAQEVAPRRPVVVRESRPPVDEEEEDAERAIRRAERQEERRDRRRAVREARRQQRQPNQTADDLTRIREIFEGAPKP